MRAASTVRRLSTDTKKTMSIQQKLLLPLCLSTLVLISSCAAPKLSQFEVQRPSRITVPREVKKVFIRADLVGETNDKLGIKSKVLQQLAQELNRFERFNVSVVNTLDEANIDSKRKLLP